MAGDAKGNAQVLKGLLDTLVLHSLVDGDNYGFGIREALHKHLGEDAGVVKEATLYPLLHRLESRKLLASYRAPGDRGSPRKYYRITAEGRQLLSERIDEWRRVTRLLNRTVLGNNQDDRRKMP